MKKINYVLVVIAALSFIVACKNINYKKTKSGLLYKIFPSDSKDSLAKPGNWVKLHFTMKVNDSVLQTTFGKMPTYVQVPGANNAPYNPVELLAMIKKGDSAVSVALADTLFSRNLAQQGQLFKKGDRVITTLRVLEVFRVDSLYMADAEAEQKKDMPRAMKEREEQMEKMRKEQEQMQQQKMEEWAKSGEIAKEIKAMEEYLASKKINAQKTGKGTYVHIEQQGTGPAAAIGKYVTVKYTGKFLTTDSVFESSTYPLVLGKSSVIEGWTEGLQLFKQGGKGTLYIPGFLAYADSGGGPDPKPFTPLKFDVEIVSVEDNPPGQ